MVVVELLKYCIVELGSLVKFPSYKFTVRSWCVCLFLCHDLEILYHNLPWYLRIHAKFYCLRQCTSKRG